VEEIAISIAAQLVQVRRAGRDCELMVERRAASSSCDQKGPSAPIGVLLAAGRSERMGRTKQVLPLPGDEDGRSLVAAAFDAVGPVCDHMIVVVAHEAERVCAALGDRAFTAAHAPPNADMIESLLAGLRRAAAIDSAAPVLLHLADHPCVRKDTVEAIMAAAAAHPGKAVIPTYGDRGGHPVLIPPALVQRVLLHAPADGLRTYWHRHPESCLRLPVDDASIALDVDVLDEYLALGAGALKH
jgi:molybdenum cofactor cytidylyltransferase